MEQGWQHRRGCTEEYLLHQRKDLVLKTFFLFYLVNHPVLWFKCGWQGGEGGREGSEGWQLQRRWGKKLHVSFPRKGTEL